MAKKPDPHGDDDATADAEPDRAPDTPRAKKPPSAHKPVTKVPSAAPSRVKKRGAEPERAAAPPRRWWEQPWLWFGVIIATVVVAGGISYAVDTDPEDVKPTGDTVAFCTAVKDLRTIQAETTPGAATTPEQLQSFRNAFGQVQATAPPEIKRTVDELAANVYDETIRIVTSTKGQNVDTQLQVADQELSALERRNERPIRRYERFVGRACGIDLNAPATPVATTAPAAPVPAPVTNPSVGPAGPTVPAPSSAPVAPTTTGG